MGPCTCHSGSAPLLLPSGKRWSASSLVGCDGIVVGNCASSELRGGGQPRFFARATAFHSVERQPCKAHLPGPARGGSLAAQSAWKVGLLAPRKKSDCERAVTAQACAKNASNDGRDHHPETPPRSARHQRGRGCSGLERRPHEVSPMKGSIFTSGLSTVDRSTSLRPLRPLCNTSAPRWSWDKVALEPGWPLQSRCRCRAELGSSARTPLLRETLRGPRPRTPPRQRSRTSGNDLQNAAGTTKTGGGHGHVDFAGSAPEPRHRGDLNTVANCGGVAAATNCRCQRCGVGGGGCGRGVEGSMVGGPPRA
jgi:hypothetical protein